MASEDLLWTTMGRMLTEDTRRLSVSRLAQAPEAAADEYRLSLAASMLTAPPTSEARLDEAEVLLHQLAGSRYDPEAMWLLARIPHVHRAAPDVTEAASRYRRLIEAHPGHALAAQAVVKLAIIELAPLTISGADTARRSGLLGVHEAALRTLDDAVARRDLHLVLAEAWLHADGKAEALVHLEAVIADKLLSGPAVGDLLVRAGELARILGDPARAAVHFRVFLTACPHDQRAYLITQRLVEVTP